MRSPRAIPSIGPHTQDLDFVGGGVRASGEDDQSSLPQVGDLRLTPTDPTFGNLEIQVHDPSTFSTLPRVPSPEFTFLSPPNASRDDYLSPGSRPVRSSGSVISTISRRSRQSAVNSALESLSSIPFFEDAFAHVDEIRDTRLAGGNVCSSVGCEYRPMPSEIEGQEQGEQGEEDTAATANPAGGPSPSDASDASDAPDDPAIIAAVIMQLPLYRDPETSEHFAFCPSHLQELKEEMGMIQSVTVTTGVPAILSEMHNAGAADHYLTTSGIMELEGYKTEIRNRCAGLTLSSCGAIVKPGEYLCETERAFYEEQRAGEEVPKCSVGSALGSCFTRTESGEFVRCGAGEIHPSDNPKNGKSFDCERYLISRGLCVSCTTDPEATDAEAGRAETNYNCPECYIDSEAHEMDPEWITDLSELPGGKIVRGSEYKPDWYEFKGVQDHTKSLKQLQRPIRLALRSRESWVRQAKSVLSGDSVEIEAGYDGDDASIGE